ncbi:MAG: hypothetical protein AB2598_20705 [Candidatus Thiodiazotropha sp.]
MDSGTLKDRGVGYMQGMNLCIGLWVLVGTALPINLFAADWLPQELAVFDLVNHQRIINDLHSLQLDDRLHESALGHSRLRLEDWGREHRRWVWTHLSTPRPDGSPGRGPACHVWNRRPS